MTLVLSLLDIICFLFLIRLAMNFCPTTTIARKFWDYLFWSFVFPLFLYSFPIIFKSLVVAQYYMINLKTVLFRNYIFLIRLPHSLRIMPESWMDNEIWFKIQEINDLLRVHKRFLCNNRRLTWTAPIYLLWFVQAQTGEIFEYDVIIIIVIIARVLISCSFDTLIAL